MSNPENGMVGRRCSGQSGHRIDLNHAPSAGAVFDFHQARTLASEHAEIETGSSASHAPVNGGV